ncbi:MAG: rod shape-determining protein MreC [Planctomycetota bacterium]
MAARTGLITANRLLAVMIGMAAVGAFTPARLLGPIGHIAGVVERLTAPISAGSRAIANAVMPAETAEPPDTAARIRELESLLRQRDLEIADLTERVASFEAGAAVSSGAMRLVTADVVAGSADPRGSVLTIRAGTADGILPGSVATVSGPNLLGYIEAIEPSLARILPLTDRNAPPIEVIVYSSSQDRVGVRFDVAPAGDGTLRGPGMFITTGLDQQPALVQVGATAYLSEASMKPHAGLEVGEIAAIDQDPESPLRQIITVRPRISTAQVASVVVRVPGAAGTDR